MKGVAWPGSLLIALPLVLMMAGCQQSTGPAPDDGVDLEPGHALLDGEAELTLRAEADSFEPEAPVTLILEHHSGEEVGFNLCFHSLEQREQDGWTLLEDPRVCTAHLELLSPGETADYEATLPANLPAGQYRFRIALYLLEREEQRDLVSGSFEVGG